MRVSAVWCFQKITSNPWSWTERQLAVSQHRHWKQLGSSARAVHAFNSSFQGALLKTKITIKISRFLGREVVQKSQYVWKESGWDTNPAGCSKLEEIDGSYRVVCTFSRLSVLTMCVRVYICTVFMCLLEFLIK